LKSLFVVNPRAGKNRRRPRLLQELEHFVQLHGLNAKCVATLRPGHATELARQAVLDGFERVVAVGGDGTMNEVAQGLVGSPTVLALVPCGSGNGLALHVGIPTTMNRALALLVDSKARSLTIDTGVANGHPFFNVMGLGFDAEISEQFNRLTRRGLPAYVRVALKTIFSFKPEVLHLESELGGNELTVSLIAVCNSDQYGNHARIAPGAKVADGRLNLTAIPQVGLLGAAVVASRLFIGNLQRHPGVLTAVNQRFKIHRRRPGLIHTDGETHLTDATIAVEIRAASLHLLVPSPAS